MRNDIKLILGSDVQRDGMYLEAQDNEGNLLLEIFYSDVTKEYDLNTFGKQVPFDLICEIMDEAKTRLPTKDDIKNNAKFKNQLIELFGALALMINEKTENDTTKEYLLAVKSWLNDCHGYYDKNYIQFNEPSLKLISDALNAGLIYE